MYFASEISFDPSSATQICRVKPSKAFARFFYYLTAGMAAERQEVETFTAVSILQQVNIALRGLGITNIVRLARDGVDFYFDEQGRPDDLAEAIKTLGVSEASPFAGTLFERLVLVLEHADEAFKYLVQIDITRRHAPGEHPISLNINGVFRSVAHAPDANTAKRQLAGVFTDQESHDAFVAERRTAFDAFVARVKAALATHIGVDEVSEHTRAKVIRPNRRRRSREDGIEYDSDWGSHSDPLFGGYHGFSDAFFHAWIWSELMHDHGLHARDVTLVDESGSDVMHLGSEGIDPSTTSVLDPDAAVEVPPGSDTVVYHGHDYAEALCEPAVQTPEAVDSDSSGWLGGMFDGSVDDSSYGSSCMSSFGSSCASSCGSSCGGCSGF